MKITVFHSLPESSSISNPNSISGLDFIPTDLLQIASPLISNRIISCIFFSNEEDRSTVQQVEHILANQWVHDQLEVLQSQEHYGIEVSVESICQLMSVDVAFGEGPEDENERAEGSIASLDSVEWSSEDTKNRIIEALDLVQEGPGRALQEESENNEIEESNSPAEEEIGDESENGERSGEDVEQAKDEQEDSTPPTQASPPSDFTIEQKQRITSAMGDAWNAAQEQQPLQAILLGQCIHTLRRALQDSSLRGEIELERFITEVKTLEKSNDRRKEDASWEFKANLVIAQAYLSLSKLPKAIVYINRNQFLGKILQNGAQTYQTLKQLLAYHTACNNDAESFKTLEQGLTLLNRMEKNQQRSGNASDPLKIIDLTMDNERTEIELQLATISQNLGKSARALEVLEGAMRHLKRAASSNELAKKQRIRVQNQLKLISKLEGMNLFKITLINGRGLPAKDLSGFSDPYVILTVDGQQRRVSSIKEQTLNPDWNEVFFFKLDPKKDTIKLVVMDEDKFTAHDHCGFATVDMKNYTWLAGTQRDITTKLNTKGNLSLKIESVVTNENEADKVE